MKATTMILIPVVLISMMLMIGKCSQLVRSSFAFVSGSHSLQLLDPTSGLMVPCGHSMHSQQHGVVGDFTVPGKHSDAQKDTGADRLFSKEFQRKVDLFNRSFGEASLSQHPTTTFPRPIAAVDPR